MTWLILDGHDAPAFAPVSHLTVGGLRDWLLSDAATNERLAALAPGITPEMAAAVSKVMRNQDLIAVARKCRVVTRFRNTIGLPGTMAVRLQPNHPTDDARGIAASIADGLLYGTGDATIGINPASDSLAALTDLLKLLDELIVRFDIPTQGYLTHEPRIGRNDGERNCISNVHGAGLSPEVAAFKAAWLMREALARRLTGVALKDESDLAIPAVARPPIE